MLWLLVVESVEHLQDSGNPGNPLCMRLHGFDTAHSVSKPESSGFAAVDNTGRYT